MRVIQTVQSNSFEYVLLAENGTYRNDRDFDRYNGDDLPSTSRLQS